MIAGSLEGFLAAGEAGIGALTVGTADIDGGLSVETNGFGAGTIDLISVAGALDITNASVTFANLGFALDDASYIFATYGSLTGSAFMNEFNTPSGYTIDYAFGGNNIALVAIPEPAAAMLGGMGLLALMRRRRRN